MPDIDEKISAPTTKTVGADVLGNETNFQRVTPIGSAYISSMMDAKIIEGDAYCIVMTTHTLSNNEVGKILMVNPVGSGKTIYLTLQQLCLDYNLGVTDVCRFQFYYNPTITSNGTLVSSVNKKAGAANNAVLTVYTAPSISAFGSLVGLRTCAVRNGSGPDRSESLFAIPPGNSFLITGVASSNNIRFLAALEWFGE